MGYSVAVASAILFTSLLIAFSFVYTGVNFATGCVEDGFNEMMRIKEEKAHTCIGIVSYNLSAPTTTLELINSGTTEINTGSLDVLIDGILIEENITVTVNGAITSICFPGEKFSVEITNLTGTPEKVKIVAGNGVSAYI